MPLLADTLNGSTDVHDRVINAVVRNAEQQATLTACYLTGIGLPPGTAEFQLLPRAVLLELGALLQLHLWESRGLTKCLPKDVPSAKVAAEDFYLRLEGNHIQLDDGTLPPLAQRVHEVWLNHIAWEGQSILGTELVLDDVAEDDFVEAIAKFIWNNRAHHFQ